MSKMPFLALSPEVIESILYELPPRDLVVCMLLNRFICTIICGSIRLRYKFVLMYFGAEDNEFSTLPIDMRLKSLSDSQQAWIGLKPATTYKFGDAFPVARYVSLAEGMLLGSILQVEDDEIAMLVQLENSYAGPGSKIGAPLRRWTGHGSGSQHSSKWISYTASPYEHGLFAEVHSEWEGTRINATVFKISVYLRHFSGPEHGPHLDHDCGNFCMVPEGFWKHIYIMDCPELEPQIYLEIVGRHLVIIVASERTGQLGQDNILVYDFLSDVLIMAFRAAGGTYRSIVFLDENYILLPNAQMGRLDIFRIPSQPTFEPVAPLISLGLPTLQAKQFMYSDISCTANPNPVSQSSYAEMRRRFSQDPKGSLRYTFHPERGRFKRAEESLCVFTVGIEKKIRAPNAERELVEEFTFVVHRSALLEIVAGCESRHSAAGRPHPGPSPVPHPWPQFDGFSMVDPLMSRIQIHPETAHTRRYHGRSDFFWQMPCARTRIPWERWGPRNTRWFNNANLAEGDMTRGWGERCVRLAPRAHSESDSADGIPYHVIDFRRANCRVARRMTKALIAQRTNAFAQNPHQTPLNLEYGPVVNFSRETIDYVPPNFSFGMDQPTYLLNKVFAHPVISALPYYSRASKERVNWDRVLIDDQMVVGCQMGDAVYSLIDIRFFG